MSLTKKLIDLARSNLNALLEKAAETADPRRKLSNLPDAELEAELERRRAARRDEQKVTDAKKKVDARLPQDRGERERIAREREARVKAERAARAAQAPPRPGPRPSAGPRPEPPPRRPPPPRRRDPELAKYYERLEVGYDSDWETVKLAYRKLMRKYHPDLHGHKSPEKLKAATEVSQALTQAYNELEKVLRK